MSPGPGAFLNPATLPDGAVTAEKPHPYRRLFARLIDLLIAWFLVGEALRIAGSPLLQSTLLLWILAGAIWVPIETALLATCGTTPGKGLLKIHVEPTGGGKIPFLKALDRSFTVYTWGLGCMVPVVYFYCGWIAYEDLKNAGTTRWDRAIFRVTYDPLNKTRIAIATTTFLALIVIATLPLL